MVKQDSKTTAKTAPKTKTTTKKVAESTAKTETKEEKITPVKETPVEKSKKTFKQSEGVLCRSVVNGKIYMTGARSSMPYQWADYGDEVEVEYRDLVAAVREKNGYVMNPWIIIMDDDFIAEFPFLADIYANQYDSNELGDILNLSIPQMEEEIRKLPTNVKNTLKGIAATWVNSGRLDSVKKIKALDEIFDTNLSMLAEVIND